MLFRTMLAILLIGGATPAADDDKARTLFDFDNDDAAKQWQPVNDGVMGGRSKGSFKITDDKTMQFFGTLSLENNGGFTTASPGWFGGFIRKTTSESKICSQHFEMPTDSGTTQKLEPKR